MKTIYIFWFILFGFTINNDVVGQINNTDSTFLLSAFNKLNQEYATSIDFDGHIYNGKEYISHDKYYLKGHPFYKSDQEQEGEACYENFLFTKIPLLYDVVLDQIIIAEPNGSLQFKLDNLKVNYFKVNDHLFIHLNSDSVAGSTLRPGFYDLLVNGKTQVLARRTKRMFEDATPRGMEGEFIIDDKFFIRKNNEYYPVSNKKTIFKVFSDTKKELQKYSRSQRLNFKKENRESSLIKLVQYYDTLPTRTPVTN